MSFMLDPQACNPCPGKLVEQMSWRVSWIDQHARHDSEAEDERQEAGAWQRPDFVFKICLSDRESQSACMVRQATLEVVFDNSSAQEVHDALWATPGVAIDYHKLIRNHDVKAGPWRNNQRTISFWTPLKAPAFVCKMIGTDVLNILDKQERSFDATTGNIVIRSTPELQSASGSKFVTSVVFTMQNVTNGRKTCRMEAIVTCEALVPWALQSTVESLMIAEGEKSLGKLMCFTKERYTDIRANQAVGTAKQPVRSLTKVGEDVFVDAVETASAAASVASDLGQMSDVESAVVVAADPLPPTFGDMPFEQAMQLHMEYQQKRTAQTMQMLGGVDDRLQQLSSEVYGMRTELQKQQQTQSALLYSLCLLSGINLGLCACLIYLRRKQAT